MKQITYEEIVQKTKTLYDPRYHYYNGRYYTEEEIQKYNKTNIEEFPNKKRYYTDPVDVCLDYLSIKKVYDQFSEDLEDYQTGVLEMPLEYDINDLCLVYDDYEKVVTLAEENVKTLHSVLSELKNTEAPIETEAKHLFKNVAFLAHHI